MPSFIVIVIELIMILKEVTTIAEIMSPRKTPDVESPLAWKASMNAPKDPVTKVTKQNIMSNM